FRGALCRIRYCNRGAARGLRHAAGGNPATSLRGRRRLTDTNSSHSRRVGVVLLQLGGPDSLDAIEPFLYNLFCDPDIIDFPFARIGRKPLAKFIATTRSRKVRHHSSVIGGVAPIRRFTEMQARALELRLAESELDAICVV